MRFIKAAVTLVRPVNLLITFLVVLLPALAVKQDTNVLSIIIAGLAAAFTAAAGNVINDIYDVEIDKINRPSRPIVKNEISIGQALYLYKLLVAASFLAAYPLGLIPLITVCAAHAVLFTYTRILKPLPLAGNFAVSMLTALTFIFSGIVTGSVERMLLPAAFAFLVNLIREIVKDIEDIDGDRSAGLITFPIRYGIQPSRRLIAALAAALVLVTLVPVITPLLSIWFVISVCIIVDPLIIYAVRTVWSSPEKSAVRKASTALKLSMLCGLAAIVVSL